MESKKRTASVLIKFVILFAVIYGVIMSTDDSYTFTKFTTLSNIGIGAAMLLFIVTELAGMRSHTDLRKQWMYIFKFMMTIGVIITFVMYITMIAPRYESGIFGAYAKHHFGSMMLHLVSPVLSVADFVVFDDGYIAKRIHAVFGIIPPLAYVGVIFVMAQNGFRWVHGMSAPYAFINFGAPTGWWGFDLSTASSTSFGIGAGYMSLFLMVVFVLIGLAMLAIKKKMYIKNYPEAE